MKNKRKLAIISLVVMMLVTTVGYAAISDNLYVNGTANTASFSVRFDDPVFLTSSATGGSFSFSHDNDGGQRGTWDVLSLSLSKAVPGKTYVIIGKVFNDGETAARFAPPPVFRDGADLFELAITAGTDEDQIIQPGSVGSYTVTIKMLDKVLDEGYTGETDAINVTLKFEQVI